MGRRLFASVNLILLHYFTSFGSCCKNSDFSYQYIIEKKLTKSDTTTFPFYAILPLFKTSFCSMCCFTAAKSSVEGRMGSFIFSILQARKLRLREVWGENDPS